MNYMEETESYRLLKRSQTSTSQIDHYQDHSDQSENDEEEEEEDSPQVRYPNANQFLIGAKRGRTPSVTLPPSFENLTLYHKKPKFPTFNWSPNDNPDFRQPTYGYVTAEKKSFWSHNIYLIVIRSIQTIFIGYFLLVHLHIFQNIIHLIVSGLLGAILLWCLFVLIPTFTQFFLPARLYAPRIWCVHTPFQEKVISSMPSLVPRYHKDYYQPSVFAWNGHLQTILPSFFGKKLDPSSNALKYHSENFLLPDGGHIVLDWSYSDGQDLSSYHHDLPLLIFLHGIASDSTSTYISNLIACITHELGWPCVAINLRGARSLLTSPFVYCIGDFLDDLGSLTKSLKTRFPDRPMGLVGFSMGANMVVKYFGLYGEAALADFGFCISTPWNLLEADLRIDSRPIYTFLYSRFMSKNMISRYLLPNKKILENRHDIDFNHACRSTTIRQLDERVTRICYGCSSVEEFYRKSSCIHYVNGVRRPLLCLNSLQDPICPPHVIPKSKFLHNPDIILATTKQGGHIHFVSHFKQYFLSRTVISKNPIYGPKKISIPHSTYISNMCSQFCQSIYQLKLHDIYKNRIDLSDSSSGSPSSLSD